METWMPVLGNDAYEVSDLGNIRRVTAAQATRPGRLLKQAPDRDGYMRVRLSPEVRKHRRVHRLVWEAFKGPIPPGLEINHDDGVKSNNRLSNLIPVTSSGNKKHALRNGLKPKGVMDTDTVFRIRALKAEGMTGQAIADQLGLAKRTVRHVCSGKKWSWLE